MVGFDYLIFFEFSRDLYPEEEVKQVRILPVFS
jgi:hypothetical protein